MMDVNEFLSITTGIFTIILLIVGIILGIRLIQVINKADRVLDNVEAKVNSLNGVFSIVNKAGDGLEYIGNKVIDTFTSIFSRFLKKKKEEIEDE